MKLVAIGDIHGRDTWKKIVEQESDADRFVFVGDYFDSFNISGDKQAENFQDILHFYEEFPQKVKLLIGNHDFHYLNISPARYSGYNNTHAATFQALLNRAERAGAINVAYGHEDWLFTHAGVSQKWADTFLKKIKIKEEGDWLDFPVEALNKTFQENPIFFDFIIGPEYNPAGDNDWQGPLWIRPNSLVPNMPKNLHQVVGHSQVSGVTKVDNPGANLILIDCLNKAEFLVIEDGEASIGVLAIPN